MAPPSDTQAAVNSVAMRVTPENVLQARAAILRNAERLHDYLNTSGHDGNSLIGLCGGDPISRQARAAFNQKIQEQAIRPARQYVAELLKGAEQLAQVARSFGITEQRIADSFKPGT